MISTFQIIILGLMLTVMGLVLLPIVSVDAALFFLDLEYKMKKLLRDIYLDEEQENRKKRNQDETHNRK